MVERLFPVIDEFKAAGRIRHVGFSTHAMGPTIVRTIETVPRKAGLLKCRAEHRSILLL